MSSVAVGPFTFSTALLAVLVGFVAAQMAAGFMARRQHADVGAPLYALLIVALLAARASFVLRWWSSYGAHPWDILNIRDGGFDLLTGLLVLAVASALALWRRPRWRRPLLAAVLTGVAGWGLVTLGGARLQQAAHPTLPAITLQALDGREVKVAGLRGTPTVINLWATWCPPCRREMPVLAQAQRELHGVRFVFADQGEDAPSVRSYLQSQHLQLHNVLLDNGSKLARHYGVRGFPTTLFIDADGHLRDIHMGELSHATLRERLRRIAPERTPGIGSNDTDSNSKGKTR